MRILFGCIEPDDREVQAGVPAGAVAMHAATPEELLESVYACTPDVLVVDREMAGLWKSLQQISAVFPVPVVVIGRTGADDLPITLTDTDVFGYVVRPLDATGLRQTILLAHAHFQRLQAAVNEVNQMREAFVSRKLIERAKGLIMQRQHLSEAEAYSALRNESRRQRIPIAELAKTILEKMDGPTATLNRMTREPAAAPSRRSSASR